MHSYTSTLPGSEPTYFNLIPNPTNSRLNLVTRISFGSSKPTKNLKFSVSASAAASAPVPAPDMSFYELLGIQQSVSLLEIKKAYKQLARKYHPDVSPPEVKEENTKTFLRVQEAYETLSDPNSRVNYDRYLARGLQYAFSAKRLYGADLAMDEFEKINWRIRWESQLEGLKKRSDKRMSEENMSWRARMRRRHEDSYR